MKSAVITFPGSNCDRDMRVALHQITGVEPHALWHEETSLPKVDLIAVPGGFSYGDYLRCGAISAKSPIMTEVVQAAHRGVPVIGICNGFQILTETGLLPGTLMRNEQLTFICDDIVLDIANAGTRFTHAYGTTQKITIPVAHHDGNYCIDADGLARLEDKGQVVFRYQDEINGSLNKIAGVQNEAGTVLGMMPHPERAVDPTHGGTDGVGFFQSLVNAVGSAA